MSQFTPGVEAETESRRNKSNHKHASTERTLPGVKECKRTGENSHRKRNGGFAFSHLCSFKPLVLSVPKCVKCANLSGWGGGTDSNPYLPLQMIKNGTLNPKCGRTNLSVLFSSIFEVFTFYIFSTFNNMKFVDVHNLANKTKQKRRKISPFLTHIYVDQTRTYMNQRSREPREVAGEVLQ